MTAKLRYHDLTKTDTVVTKILQVISTPVDSVVSVVEMPHKEANTIVFASLCGISTTHSFTHYLYASLNQV